MKIDLPQPQKLKKEQRLCCKLKECRNKTRSPNELHALREEVRDLWEIIEELIQQ